MKSLIYTLSVFLSFIIFQLVNQFLFCPQYHFKTPTPFKGQNWYNPYNSIIENKWIKCNFHAHPSSWDGITNGKGTAKDIYHFYQSLGYTIACISEYQKRSADLSAISDSISVYEHGYNLTKTHQQIIGASHVEWLDFFFRQNLSNKQRILDKLSKENNAIIVINHPQKRKSYSTGDMSLLSNYNCMEVLSPPVDAAYLWDAALSSGHPVFIMANDDMHNVFDTIEGGRFCTWLNVPSNNKQNIIQSLKIGKGFGMKIAQINQEPEINRMERIRNKLPDLKKLSFLQDSLQIEMSKPAKKISFIGTRGVTRKIVSGVSKAYYVVKPYDTYIRTLVEFEDGTEIYLNPIYRYSNNPFENFSSSSVLKAKSYFYYTLGLFVLTAWCFILIKFIWGERIHLTYPEFIRRSGKFNEWI